MSTIDVGARDPRSMPTQPSVDIATLIAAARAQRRSMLTEPEAKAFLRAQTGALALDALIVLCS